jgi:hypothetical protein
VVKACKADSRTVTGVPTTSRAKGSRVSDNRSDGSAFIGFERVVGLVGRAGSFGLQRTGVFESGLAKESYVVVPGSGTGELQGLRGEGTTAVGHGMEHPFTLDYELD